LRHSFAFPPVFGTQFNRGVIESSFSVGESTFCRTLEEPREDIWLAGLPMVIEFLANASMTSTMNYRALSRGTVYQLSRRRAACFFRPFPPSAMHLTSREIVLFINHEIDVKQISRAA